MDGKRLLTEKEIAFICKDIESLFPRFLPTEMKQSYIQTMMHSIRKQLQKETVCIDFTDISIIKKELEKHVHKSIIQAGESVGVISAQSIGERQTQLTLNSFHQSGLTVATVVTGVPRFLELLNATKDPKVSSNSFFIRQSLQTPLECRLVIRDSLIYHSMNDLIVKQSIFIAEKAEEYWYTAYETIYNNQFRYYSSGITFYLDVEKIYKHKILISTIKDRIENIYSDVCCVISPLHVGQIDLFIDTSDVKLTPDENLPEFIKHKNPIEIYLEEVVLPRILEIDICGIRNIKQYYLKKEEERWFVETEGANLCDILSLPYIDIETVSRNNMWEIYNIMGIEATREFLMEEFTKIVSSDGTFINPSHVLLLVDLMTYQGTIVSISRYGMKKEQMSVLSRSSFEESLDQFCNAGFYAEKEPIQSVSANIMCGKRSNIGSGLCTLMVDWKKLK